MYLPIHLIFFSIGRLKKLQISIVSEAKHEIKISVPTGLQQKCHAPLRLKGLQLQGVSSKSSPPACATAFLTLLLSLLLFTQSHSETLVSTRGLKPEQPFQKNKSAPKVKVTQEASSQQPPALLPPTRLISSILPRPGVRYGGWGLTPPRRNGPCADLGGRPRWSEGGPRP